MIYLNKNTAVRLQCLLKEKYNTVMYKIFYYLIVEKSRRLCMVIVNILSRPLKQ